VLLGYKPHDQPVIDQREDGIALNTFFRGRSLKSPWSLVENILAGLSVIQRKNLSIRTKRDFSLKQKDDQQTQ
jgi:hypothetical protein